MHAACTEPPPTNVRRTNAGYRRLWDAGVQTLGDLELAVNDPLWLTGAGASAGLRSEHIQAVRRTACELGGRLTSQQHARVLLRTLLDH